MAKEQLSLPQLPSEGSENLFFSAGSADGYAAIASDIFQLSDFEDGLAFSIATLPGPNPDSQDGVENALDEVK